DSDFVGCLGAEGLPHLHRIRRKRCRALGRTVLCRAASARPVGLIDALPLLATRNGPRPVPGWAAQRSLGAQLWERKPALRAADVLRRASLGGHPLLSCGTLERARPRKLMPEGRNGMDEQILRSEWDGVVELVLNRPEKLNALTTSMFKTIRAA